MKQDQSCLQRHGGFHHAAPLLFLLLLAAGHMTIAKVREIRPRHSIRPVIIRNVSYRADGGVFAVPNFVSAGSVALFQVNEQSAIAAVPPRLSEKDFIRSSGLFFLRKQSDGDPFMAFVPLAENLSGYAVDFATTGGLLAIAGGNQVLLYDSDAEWEMVKSLTIGQSVTRAVFSPDGKRLAILADGKLYLFSTETYAAVATVEPVPESRFCDVTFSSDNSRCAVFEYRTVMFDGAARIRIFSARNGAHDRDLPQLPARTSSEPLQNLPLLSYAPGDTLLAVTVPAGFAGKVFLVQSNDGTMVREFKGYCHAFSPDGTMFVADGKVLSTRDWSILGKLPRSTRTCVFSPTEPVIVTVTQESIRRFRIEE
jgi:WD40 repeat protein